mmetsp:Transcript_82096/g.265954  ORF Transcript_82096/g.265954 Transcript_82096/m.265954 type:complete len:514 (-) Transcript_82096:29-1570(-)
MSGVRPPSAMQALWRAPCRCRRLPFQSGGLCLAEGAALPKPCVAARAFASTAVPASSSSSSVGGGGMIGTAEVASADAAALGKLAQKALAEGLLGEEQWQRFAARASQLTSEMSVQEAAKLAAAFSTARSVDFDLFARLSARTLEHLQAEGGSSEFRALELRRLTLAFGRARAFDSELMEALVPIIAERAADFRPRDLARITDAYARMPVASADLFAFVADVLTDYLYDLEPPELARLSRAFGQAAVYSEELFDALCVEVKQRIRSFGALDCVVFLEGLARVHEGLPEEMKRDDSATVNEVAERLGGALGSLSASELIRSFRALVQLDHYDRRLVHRKLCPALALRLGQLQGPSAFSDLAELLHCLSLLPAQSHKSVELAMTTASALRELGYPPPGGRHELRALGLVAKALAQLGQEDEELFLLLASAVHGRGGDGRPGAPPSLPGTPRAAPHELLSLADDGELTELRRALGLPKGASATAVLGPAREAIAVELHRRQSLEAEGAAWAEGSSE